MIISPKVDVNNAEQPTSIDGYALRTIDKAGPTATATTTEYHLGAHTSMLSVFDTVLTTILIQ
jgi:hypothetical protein